jgi:alkylhydroperoxidase family enzyme
LHEAGFSEEEVFDIADTVGFYNMLNRVATAVDMSPNPEYHALNR